MRILGVSSSYPLTDNDSTAPFMEEMALALVGRGHDVRVIVPHIAGLETGTRNGIDVRPFRFAPARWEHWGHGQSLDAEGRVRRSSLLATPTAMTAMLIAVHRHLRRWQPDVVHLHWLLPQGALGPLLSRTAPVIVSLHGADVAAAARGGSYQRLARAALRRADHLVAASAEMFEAVAPLAPDISDRATVIPHGANAELFRPADRAAARRSLGLSLDGHLLLAVGRLVEKKGFEQLVGAMAHLDDREVRLVVAGEGPLRERLDGAVRGMSNVTLLGRVERGHLAGWFAAADLIVIPSVRTERDLDSGPVVFVEALASGRGVVSTPVGMVPDVLVDGHNGVLVPEPEPAALAAAIASALPVADLLGENARLTFHRLGDWSRVASGLEDVYRLAIAHRRARVTRSDS